MTELMNIAKIQSIEASNRIEGIFTADERLKKLVMDKTIPISRNEQEIAGYRDVLNTIHENHDFVQIKPGVILQFHRDLYKFQGEGAGGKYKVSEIENLCKAYDEALQNEIVDPLILIPMFVLDFLCIHPFNDGNGRMSRLLTLLLLYRSGYIVGKYISIEKMIENSKETYYEVLQASSVGWHEEENDYAPFVRYILGIVVATYKELKDNYNKSNYIGDK